MHFISHRGNINGPYPSKENKPLYIEEAVSKGYDVEIDVWWYKNQFYLGHDEPIYPINELFLENIHLWCHAKNLDALQRMSKNDCIHCFYHDNDDFVLTSKGFIWNHPRIKISKYKCILVLPERYNVPLLDKEFSGICSDYIEDFKKEWLNS